MTSQGPDPAPFGGGGARRAGTMVPWSRCAPELLLKRRPVRDGHARPARSSAWVQATSG